MNKGSLMTTLDELSELGDSGSMLWFLNGSVGVMGELEVVRLFLEANEPAAS